MAKDTLREVNAYNVDAVNNVAFMPKEEPKKETFFADGGHVETKKSKDKLEVANKYNLKKFNRKENLFFVGGNVADMYGGWQTPDWDWTAQGAEKREASKQGSVGAIMSMYNTPVPVASKSLIDLTTTTPTSSTPQTIVNVATPVSNQLAEKKDGKNKIPTATVPLAAQLGNNEARWESLAKKNFAKESGLFMSPEGVWNGNKEALTEGYKNSKNWLGISKKDNPFSKGNIGGTMKTVGLAAASMADQIDTGDPRGLFDTLDPVYHLAGGRESAVGNAMSDTGVALTKSGVPIAMLAGAALKIVGGLTNAAFGIKEDKEAKKRADESINTNKNFMSNAGYYDDIKGPASMTNTNVYEGGWFSQGKADDKNAALARQMADAYSWADRSVINNVRNISSDQLSDFLRNYSAFGGYLTRPKRRRKIKR